jgi:putative nucleotidyltransferase with HDIG domain
VNPTTIASVVDEIDALPRLPESALRIMDALRNPQASMAKIVEAIRFDQSMTTELLRICNSAYYSRSRRIASLQEAIVVLGATNLMRIVLAAHSRTLLAAEQRGYGLPPGALWRHSVAVALAGDKLGEGLPPAQRATLFTAGLLHDVGKILLNERMELNYAAIALRVARERIPFPQAEQEVLGFTHADVGAAIAERWGLPEPIVRCIRYHHQPALARTSDPLLDRVHVADIACLLLGIGGGDDGTHYRADIGALRRVNLPPGGIERLGLETVLALKQVEAAHLATAA